MRTITASLLLVALAALSPNDCHVEARRSIRALSEQATGTEDTGDAYDEEECHDDCEMCQTNTTCGDSKEKCTWDNDTCREMTEEEEYLYQLAICSPIGANFKGCKDAKKTCKFDKKTKTCNPKEDAPETCEFECGECNDESECGTNSECGWIDGECENLMEACDDECGNCMNESLCTGTGEECTWDNSSDTGTCREMTEEEEYLDQLAICSAIGANAKGCKNVKKTCKFDKKTKTCNPKEDAPETCEFECGKCNDESECGTNSECGWIDGECENVMEACDDECGNCADATQCGNSEKMCIFESDTCREMDDTEECIAKCNE